MTTHTATCSCGQLRLVAQGDPIRVSMCHCLACQVRTGSTYGVQARFANDRVEVSGVSTEYTRIGDGGDAIHFHFCPTCGATVYYRVDDDDLTAVMAGTFADPTFPPPQRSVWEQRRHPWVSVPTGAERLD
ncbi:MAG: GFA family protein [Betaproteobacteria bacterium]